MKFIKTDFNHTYFEINKTEFSDEFITNKINEYSKDEVHYIKYFPAKIELGVFSENSFKIHYQNGIMKDKEVGLNEVEEIRMFNKDFELFVWKESEFFKGRIIIDKYSEDISEDNCIEIEYYLDNKIRDRKDLNLEKYVTRNYFEFDEIGKINFVDARIVKFLEKGGNNA